MPPIPVVPTETFASCAKAMLAEAAHTSAIEKIVFIICRDLRSALQSSIPGNSKLSGKSLRCAEAPLELGSSCELSALLMAAQRQARVVGVRRRNCLSRQIEASRGEGVLLFF